MKVYDHPELADISLPTVMQALSDPCRIAILRELMLKNRALACNEVPLDISKATRSHHFEVLRDAGLIRTAAEGTKCMTTLRRQEIDSRFPGLLALVNRDEPRDEE
jgi:DNA-binding transcriptional ArsR family regulator